MINFDIIFDNGGGITLQTENNEFIHYYEDPNHASEDISLLLNGETTDDWDGHQPEQEIKYENEEEFSGGYRWLEKNEIQEIIKTKKIPENLYSWLNARSFFMNFGLTFED